MGGSILNREDYKTAIPQLSSQLNDLLQNNVIINRTVITLSEGKVSDLNNYLGYFQNLATGYFQAIAGDIEYLSSREAYINHLKTDIASFGYLTAETADLRYATISNLNAAVARIGDLEADHVSVSDFTAATGRIGALEADHVSVTDLAATNADVAHLKVGDLTIGGVTVNIYDLAVAIKNSAMASGTTWYKVSASTPTAPAVFDPTADGWSQTEPAYIGGTTDHLYSCLRVVYADDDPLGTRHFQWSDVHMIQSWEAAKSAYSYAGVAKTAADKAVKDLSQVENVVGVVNWIAEHGEMISQAGGTFDPAKVYFIVDPNGDYHIGNTHYSVVTEPKAEDIDDYYILNIDESVQNYVMTHLFVDGEGLWLIPEENATVQTSSKKILIATGGQGHDYPVAGTYIIGKDESDNDTPFAQFTSAGATISSNGVQVSHLGYGESTDQYGRLTEHPFYTLGTRANNEQIGGYSTAIGIYVSATGWCSYAEGCSGSNPDDPTMERITAAIGDGSHAEGKGTIARRTASHSEGEGTEASGSWSHAQNINTVAQGMASHAEGSGTKALGSYSHSQNRGTVAGYDSQTVVGKLNDNQPNTAFEIGNGTSNNARSNAFTVDWDGNVKAQGWAGFIQMFAGATAPSGWLFCDGSEVAVADYPLLHAVIGDTYGTPSDSDHFLLPNFMGRTPIGAGQGTGLTNRTLGQKVGAEMHKLTVDEMPSHRHKEVGIPWFQSNRSMSSGKYTLADIQTSNVYTEYTGEDQEHNNMQPSLGINFIICTGETS